MIFDETMRDALAEAKVIAVIGAKDKAGQPVNMVGTYLIDQGYTVIPVHPIRQNVWGLTTYKTIADIPVPVDIVNVFRASQYCADHADEVLELKHTPKMFWMQSGIRSQEAGEKLAANGIAVVEDKCIMVEHSRLGLETK
ncbi:CoA-binding protein [Halodesulfovibrio spirochaetisodalis]|uniref:CoA-binding protein n=1 Tax=Halodesulfovibrio spirochaetisodalis TaxID=1560234 RepID=A0A1B7X9W1_9BACT|nr:CoA-binding protein [Halodesulfovibrio spirochaetisodalis]OBQ46173.1 CoA-binding protein [Halodesulfovibrio spirochaetisodalis]